MLAQAHQEFVEAEMAYHRERIIADMRQARRGSRVSWAHRLRETLRSRNSDPVRGAARYQLDGPIVRPAGVTSLNYYTFPPVHPAR